MLREQLVLVFAGTATDDPVPLEHHRLACLHAVQVRADFDDEDVALARRIQPLLTLLARQASVLEQRGRVLTP